jgi:RNA polymerase sigma-70 factor (ECF subfamily)
MNRESGIENRPIDLPVRIGQRPFVMSPPEAEVPGGTRLVEAARAGDRRAFESLYSLYAPMVHGILFSRVPRRDVEDLVQEVFLTVFRRLSTLREPAAFPGWLAAIVRNCAADHLRKVPATQELPGEMISAEASVLEAHAILRIVLSLPEAYRETLVLRLVEGMTGPEIASRTGLTPGSVRVNLHRGMALLRERLGRREDHA